MAAATVSVLRLPLSAVVLTVLLTANAGAGTGPLIIVAVVAAQLAALALDRLSAQQHPDADDMPAAGANQPDAAASPEGQSAPAGRPVADRGRRRLSGRPAGAVSPAIHLIRGM